jgi:hypothetical protein
MTSYKKVDDILRNTEYEIGTGCQQTFNQLQQERDANERERIFSNSIDDAKELVNRKCIETVEQALSLRPHQGETNYELKMQNYGKFCQHAINSIIKIQNIFETIMGRFINAFYQLAEWMRQKTQQIFIKIKSVIRRAINRIRN